jgi:2-oxoisovalerate dehydrogenase E1 component beta subunit
VLEAASRLADEEIEVEVVDLLSLRPLDERTVLGSVQRTGRPVIVHEGPRTGGFGAEIAALVAEKALLRLEAPVLRITGADEPPSFSGDARALPSVERIAEALRESAFF